jgi:hypothetical protein
MSNELTLSDFHLNIQKGFTDFDLNKGWITTQNGKHAFLGSDGELKHTRKEIEAEKKGGDSKSSSKNDSGSTKLDSELDKTFGDIAKKSKDAKEFMTEAGKIKNVSSELSNHFFEKYGKGGSMEQAAKNYMDSKSDNDKLPSISDMKDELVNYYNDLASKLDANAKKTNSYKKMNTYMALANRRRKDAQGVKDLKDTTIKRDYSMKILKEDD